MSTPKDPGQADINDVEDQLSGCISYWRSGTFIQTATVAGSVKPGSHYDFISFLGIAQRQQIDFLPINWQPALDKMGEGRTAEIREALINLQTSYAFKRFKPSDQDEGKIFQELVSEISVLGHGSIRSHPTITRLEGVSWDIPRGAKKVWPVLVFEKTKCGDLEKFAHSQAGKVMGLEDRLKLCVDVGTAVNDLHSYYIIHGDIGPRNVLVFENSPNNYVAKVSDFGYSTLVADDDLVYMPRTRPWNAPEWHHRAFTTSDAMKMDVYSFGMLCLWFLFKDTEGYPTHSHIDELKLNDTLLVVAQQLVLKTPGLSEKQRSNLNSFFNLTIVRDPNSRIKDFNQLVLLLNQNCRTFPPTAESLGKQPSLSDAHFEIMPSIYQFYLSDYRVRSHIAACLEAMVLDSTSGPFPKLILKNAAFQLALCYKIGFGVARDDNQSRIRLGQSKMPDDVFDRQINRLKHESLSSLFQSPGFQELYRNGLLHEIDFDRHYGEHEQLDMIETSYRREITDVESILGQTHPVVSILQSRLSRILNAHGLWKKSEELCSQIMKTSVETLGREHPNTLMSMEGLATVLWNQGRWSDAEELETEIMETSLKVLGPEHLETLTRMANLASTYRQQGRWKAAEDLLLYVTKMRKNLLGLENPTTLTSEANLAWVYRSQGRWVDAEQLEVQVMEVRRRVLGADHPDTLASMTNLASTYMNQGRWKDAEELFTPVMEHNSKVLGAEHPDTLSSMSHLSSALSSQGRWDEAERLEVQVMNMSSKLLGADHPDSLTNMNNLALTYRRQGRWKEAEDLINQATEKRKRILGMEHPDTLASMAILSSIFWSQGQLGRAEELGLQVTESKKKILGAEHPDTLTSMSNLASIYRDQGRWDEAEELFAQVMEKELKVLGTEHPDTLATMANLAGTFLEQGRWEKAGDLYVRLLQIYKQVQGAEHPDTLTIMANLALTHRYQRRLKEAEELEVQILDISSSVLGPEHPDTLVSMANLAMTLSEQERWEEAKELGKRAMELMFRVLGADHPDSLTSMHNFASILTCQGNLEEAEQLHSQVAQTRKRILGAEHPDTLRSMIDLAGILNRKGRHE